MRKVYVAALIGVAVVFTLDPISADSQHGSAGQETCRDLSVNYKPKWRTVSIGTFKNTFELRNALDAAGIHVGDSADEILARPNFNTSSTRLEYDLVVYSAKELGLVEESVSHADIYERASCLGLELCPAEIGPQLRLNYLDQPQADVINVAMEPMTTYYGELIDFSISHFPNGAIGLMLLGGDGRPNAQFSNTTRFIFTQPRALARTVR